MRGQPQYWRYVAAATSFGFTALASILLGLWAGRWLDERLGTQPFLMICGVLLGVGLSFYNLFTAMGLLRSRRGPGGDGPDA